MKLHHLILTSATLAVCTVLLLSSFRKENTNQEPMLDGSNGSNYKSTSKKVTKKGGVTLSTSFENDYYTPQNRNGFYYFELQADDDENTLVANKTPLNISLVIDRSGSMAGTKMQNAKLAAKHVIDQLSSRDYISIVIYDSKVDVLQPAVRAYNKPAIKKIIDEIYDRGGTNLMGGAIKGYEEVQRNYRSDYINRVLLLSDGLANEGITEPSKIAKIVRDKDRELGISISTFGVGNDYNEDLMTDMAETGNGNYYFISDANMIASIFSRELNGLQRVIAQNTKVTVNIAPNVVIQKVYGAKYDQVGRTLSFNLRDLFAGDTKGVLIKYNITGGIQNDLTFNTQLNFTNKESETMIRISSNNTISYTNNENRYLEYFSEWVSTQVALYESNERLEIAMKEVDKGNYTEAKKIVEENKTYIKQKEHLVSKSPTLKAAQDNNESYNSKLDNVSSMEAEEVKYMQKDAKSTNYQIRNKKIK